MRYTSCTSVKNCLNDRVPKDYASSDDASRNETSSDENSNVDTEDPVPASIEHRTYRGALNLV
jgi:hypothetical protein